MLSLENLTCAAGAFRLEGVSLTIADDEYFVLLGPTGSGKTTLLKCLAGLCPVAGGRILLDGSDIARLDPSERSIAYLPQDYSLFPHLDARGNILFGLQLRRVARSETERRLCELAGLLELEPLLDRRIDHLSGGERQRVALARALAVRPRAILLDEPFSAVDPGLRTRLWFEVKRLLKSLGVTVIHVTHNLVEASAVGERLGVLIEGRLEQCGTSDEFFSRPATERVARYHGIRNIFDGEIASVEGAKVTIQCEGFRIVALPGRALTPGSRVRVCVRPQDLKIIKAGQPVRDELADNILEGVIVSAYFCDDFCTMVVRSGGEFELRFPAYIYRRHALEMGKTITFAIWQRTITIFDAVTP